MNWHDTTCGSRICRHQTNSTSASPSQTRTSWPRRLFTWLLPPSSPLVLSTATRRCESRGARQVTSPTPSDELKTASHPTEQPAANGLLKRTKKEKIAWLTNTTSLLTSKWLTIPSPMFTSRSRRRSRKHLNRNSLRQGNEPKRL